MLTNTLFACASLVAAAVAQTSRIAFTVLPTNVTAGKPVTLQWGGGDGSAVTITLQQGPSTNLKTVDIITGDASGFSYTWTPRSSLPDADDYALKISQGDSVPNYTGMITLTGGSAAVSSGAVASATSSASSSVTTSPSSGGVVAGGFGFGSSSSSSANVTTTQVVNANATATKIIGTGGAVGTGAVGTGAGASGSAATGTALHRNTTMSKATLSSTSSSSSAAVTTTGSGTTTTSSGPAPSSSSQSGAVMVAASNFALLCAAIVGVVYLG